MTNTNISNGSRAIGLYPYNPDGIQIEAFASSVLSELPNHINIENIAVLSDEPEQRIPYSNVEDSSRSFTDNENLLLFLFLQNN